MDSRKLPHNRNQEREFLPQRTNERHERRAQALAGPLHHHLFTSCRAHALHDHRRAVNELAGNPHQFDVAEVRLQQARTWRRRPRKSPRRISQYPYIARYAAPRILSRFQTTDVASHPYATPLIRETPVMRLSAVAVLLGVFAVVAYSQASDKVPVFVKAATSADGFSDPSKERQESIKDINDKIRGSKALSVASSEKEAVVFLEVLARGTRREVNGWAVLSGTGQNKSRLEVRLVAGEFSAEFGADGGSSGVFTGYGKAAGSVVKQVEAWVKENRERLKALRN